MDIKEVARKGGQTTLNKYGPDYFKNLQAKRKNKRGKNSIKEVLDNNQSL